MQLESVTLGGGAETRAEREAQQAVALGQQRREAEAQRMATAQQEAKLLQDKRDAAAAALQSFWAERAASMRREAEEQHELAMAEAQRKRRSDGQGHIGAKVARHTDDTVDTVEAEMGPPTSTPAGSDQLGDRFFSLYERTAARGYPIAFRFLPGGYASGDSATSGTSDASAAAGQVSPD